MQRDVLLLAEMIDAAEQAQALADSVTSGLSSSTATRPPKALGETVHLTATATVRSVSGSR
jgi:hypothetical protein